MGISSAAMDVTRASLIQTQWLPQTSNQASQSRKAGYLLNRRKMTTLQVSAAAAVSYNGNKLYQNLKHKAATCLAATAVLSAMGLSSNFLIADSAIAMDQGNVQTLFQRSCVGCHVGGGNILQPGATLSATDLERNGVAAVDDIFRITYSGRGRMPGFGEQCAPRGQCTFGPRLSDEEIRALAEFVRSQADQGWKISQ